MTVFAFCCHSDGVFLWAIKKETKLLVQGQLHLALIREHLGWRTPSQTSLPALCHCWLLLSRIRGLGEAGGGRGVNVIGCVTQSKGV